MDKPTYLVKKNHTQLFWDGVCWGVRRRAKEYKSIEKAKMAKHGLVMVVIVQAVDYPIEVGGDGVQAPIPLPDPGEDATGPEPDDFNEAPYPA